MNFGIFVQEAAGSDTIDEAVSSCMCAIILRPEILI